MGASRSSSWGWLDAAGFNLSWSRFWHVPVRAERLALMRILLALAMLTDQLFQLLPNLPDFWGPEGIAPQGTHDTFQLRHWYWTVFFFNTDHLPTLYTVFSAWVGATALLLVGWQTRVMNVLVWLLTMCFICRNPDLLNGGDDAMQVALFLLMLMPSGNALSLDARRRRRAGRPLPEMIPAWPVRVVQIQLCVIYMTTGLVKLEGNSYVDGPWWHIASYHLVGTWWDGTSIHYALNYVTMSRWSFAQFPQPLWFTAVLTYTSVWWETLFPFLVLNRWTRPPALVFGVLFHVGIWLTIEVGWFSFYMFPYYAVWVPDRFWARRSRPASVSASDEVIQSAHRAATPV
jgi:hypothetical protein